MGWVCVGLWWSFGVYWLKCWFSVLYLFFNVDLLIFVFMVCSLLVCGVIVLISGCCVFGFASLFGLITLQGGAVLFRVWGFVCGWY